MRKLALTFSHYCVDGWLVLEVATWRQPVSYEMRSQVASGSWVAAQGHKPRRLMEALSHAVVTTPRGRTITTPSLPSYR